MTQNNILAALLQLHNMNLANSADAQFNQIAPNNQSGTPTSQQTMAGSSTQLQNPLAALYQMHMQQNMANNQFNNAIAGNTGFNPLMKAQSGLQSLGNMMGIGNSDPSQQNLTQVQQPNQDPSSGGLLSKFWGMI